jgi:hypothetical protein
MPTQALKSACGDVKNVCEHVDSVFQQALADFESKQHGRK